MRREHVQDDYEYVRPDIRGFLGDTCAACGEDWPCDAARLLAELDRERSRADAKQKIALDMIDLAVQLKAERDHLLANPPRWQGRDHHAPVPHLAEVQR